MSDIIEAMARMARSVLDEDGDDVHDLDCVAIIAALRAAEAAGWRLMPVEPTITLAEMIAYHRKPLCLCGQGHCVTGEVCDCGGEMAREVLTTPRPWEEKE